MLSDLSKDLIKDIQMDHVMQRRDYIISKPMDASSALQTVENNAKSMLITANGYMTKTTTYLNNNPLVKYSLLGVGGVIIGYTIFELFASPNKKQIKRQNIRI